ncbi:prephenate dehydratase [Thiotrichales bacterium 19S3-7]|nr:prephenate dehydratase [Thiotrichales bacterium 19S3-7]MCF6802489.1 prephenate dehydratase [Thiotrichales bacterium 19S3-11]
MTEKLIAFQGAHGAYSEEALRHYFGNDVEGLPCESFAEVFDMITKGHATHGILPVENSLAGSVIQAYDELLKHSLSIQAEVILRIEHNLLAMPGVGIDDVKTVLSHPQALAQCHENIVKYGLKPEPYYDTAGAAKFISESQDVTACAIASHLSAETYNLEIIKSDFEDEEFNFTRFFVLGNDNLPFNEHGIYKTSIAFLVEHQPQSLVKVLEEFSSRYINMSKIESRPSREGPWRYMFLVDIMGNENQPLIAEALNAVKAQTPLLRVLGSYQAASLN